MAGLIVSVERHPEAEKLYVEKASTFASLGNRILPLHGIPIPAPHHHRIPRPISSAPSHAIIIPIPHRAHQVKLGENEERTVVSGLVDYMPPEGKGRVTGVACALGYSCASALCVRVCACACACACEYAHEYACAHALCFFYVSHRVDA